MVLIEATVSDASGTLIAKVRISPIYRGRAVGRITTFLDLISIMKLRAFN